MKQSRHLATLQIPIEASVLVDATEKANSYLCMLPKVFHSDSNVFYSTLNQRNLSGFIGEVLKHSIYSCSQEFIPNPHPDGRPDLLDLRSSDAREHYERFCFDSIHKLPIRESLAPFKFGGVEIKCSIGKIKNASESGIGVPRCELVNGITYWAHHAHACDLLGVYYDYDHRKEGAPQIRALFFVNVLASDWHKVSVGDPKNKKTSNTSLNHFGIKKLYRSLALYSEEAPYPGLLDRLNIAR